MADTFDTSRLETATLAAAIVIARGAKTVEAIEEARVDAAWLTSPAPTNSRYKAWQVAHALTPTTPAEDQAAASARSQAAAQIAGRLQR